MKIPVYENEEIEIDDEYDTDDIISKIDEKKHVMIRAKYAGSGRIIYLNKWKTAMSYL